MDSDSDIEWIDDETRENANLVPNVYIPEKSRSIYQYVYNQFIQWRADNKAGKTNESTILAYLEQKSKTVKPSTLWSTYSMLKPTLILNENIDISSYKNLKSYIKNKSMGYRPNKSQTLTQQQINRFIKEAYDGNHLLTKIVLIMGISGACQCDELSNMSIDDIEDLGSMLIVRIPRLKNRAQRSFTVTNLDYIKVYRKYLSKRPPLAKSRRLFLKYIFGNCFDQNIGLGKIGSMPSVIAGFLKLPNIEAYTGHCFRRTAATLVTNRKEVDITYIERTRGQNGTIKENSTQNSTDNKTKIQNKLVNCEFSNRQHELGLKISNVFGGYVEHSCINHIKNSNSSENIETITLSSGVSVARCINCTPHLDGPSQ